MSTGSSSRKQSNSTMHRQPAVELYVQTGSTQKLMLMGRTWQLIYTSTTSWTASIPFALPSYHTTREVILFHTSHSLLLARICNPDASQD